MNKSLYILLVLLTAFASCKGIRKIRIHSKVNKPQKIYIKSEYSSEIKINGKFLSSADSTDDKTDIQTGDQTDDKAEVEKKPEQKKKKTGITAESFKLGNNKDETSDRAEKYIKDPRMIEFYTNYERLFNEYILDNLSSSIKEEEMGIEVYGYEWMKEEETNFSILLTIEIYNEGEYNMIENVDTRMNITSIFYEGSKVVAELKKNYIIKTGIGYPLERQRLDQLSKDVVIDIVKIFKKKLFLKEKKINKK